MGLKLAGDDAQAGSAQTVDECLIEFLRQCRWRCVDERWPIASAAVSVQSKLRYHEDCAADIQHRAIHFAQVVCEDPQIFYFIGQSRGVFLIISFADAKKNAQTGTDAADALAAYRDRRFTDSLNYRAHFGFRTTIDVASQLLAMKPTCPNN